VKAVFQRVTGAKVTVDDKTVGEIGNGVMLLVGITPNDTTAEADLLAKKVSELRVFEDDAGKMNVSLLDIGGSVLAVSQFTLCADTSRGRRPDFFGAAPFQVAEPLFEYFCEAMKKTGVPVQTGVFGADMQVSLVNDGPVTILLDTDTWKKGKA
jgi:D-tyrosyl-tRNA(Tyr) deacylase